MIWKGATKEEAKVVFDFIPVFMVKVFNDNFALILPLVGSGASLISGLFVQFDNKMTLVCFQLFLFHPFEFSFIHRLSFHVHSWC
jgi:hypothetical protein